MNQDEYVEDADVVTGTIPDIIRRPSALVIKRQHSQEISTMSPSQARFLVDKYYQMQHDRIVHSSQQRQLKEKGETFEAVEWLEEASRSMEQYICCLLTVYSNASPIARWAKSIVGIGPVISSGLAAHIDIAKCPTAGHLYSFAGLNPRATWNKGERRPWNAALKVLSWKISKSFVMSKSSDNSYYGPLYDRRKAEETENNQAGKYAEQAKHALESKNYSKDTVAKAEYMKGRLPLAHIDARVRRWTVKLFLSHYHAVLHHMTYGTTPPTPYVLAHCTGHVHMIRVPNYEPLADWDTFTD